MCLEQVCCFGCESLGVFSSAGWVYGIAAGRVECSVALRAIAILANSVCGDVIEAQAVGAVDEICCFWCVHGACGAGIPCGVGTYILGIGDWGALACRAANNHFAGAVSEVLKKVGVGHFVWM
jgi:hypothetical protein